jgi:hypothetical protein
MERQPQLFDSGDDGPDLGRRGAWFHDNDHKCTCVSAECEAFL